MRRETGGGREGVGGGKRKGEEGDRRRERRGGGERKGEEGDRRRREGESERGRKWKKRDNSNS